MKKDSSTKLILKHILYYVQECYGRGKVPTKIEVKWHMDDVIQLTNYMFGNSLTGSTEGSMRSILSSLVKGKKKIPGLEVKIKNKIPFFVLDGDVANELLIQNRLMNFVPKESKTIHRDTQYLLCETFYNLGFTIHVPKSDRNKENQFDKTIEKSFGDRIVDIDDEKGRQIDLIVFHNETPYLLFEVEESTNLDGLHRMESFIKNQKLKNLKTYIVSSNNSYEKKFKREINFYSKQKCKFIKYDKIYDYHVNDCNEKEFKRIFGNVILN